MGHPPIGCVPLVPVPIKYALDRSFALIEGWRKKAGQISELLIIYQQMNGDRHFNKQFLRACLEQDQYRFHPSAWRRLQELQISLNDTSYVLRHGSVEEEPELDAAIGHWRFTIHGRTVDDKELTIMFAFVEIEGLLILTIAE
jgi:hypothetical protein